MRAATARRVSCHHAVWCVQFTPRPCKKSDHRKKLPLTTTSARPVRLPRPTARVQPSTRVKRQRHSRLMCGIPNVARTLAFCTPLSASHRLAHAWCGHRIHSNAHVQVPRDMGLRVGRLWISGLAVYQNQNGTLYFKSPRNRRRVRVDPGLRWATMFGVRMRGQVPLTGDNLPSDDSFFEEDDNDDELRAAINASLAETSGDSMRPTSTADSMVATPADASDTTSAGTTSAGANDTAAAPAGSSAGPVATPRCCAICLTEASTYMCRPCNHCCACVNCQHRLRGRPCPICRKPTRAMERVFFA